MLKNLWRIVMKNSFDSLSVPSHEKGPPCGSLSQIHKWLTESARTTEASLAPNYPVFARELSFSSNLMANALDR